jgi:cyclopropane fatty-acyl-phospholipid synthase-like methyltransferase
LVKDLDLKSKTSLLELEPGLGGSTRAIVRATAAWVTAFASDAGLAARAAELSAQSGFAKKASVQPLDVAQPGFRKASFDHALAAHGLMDIEPLEDILKAVKIALKPKGKLVVAQFVVQGEATADDALAVLGPSRAAPASLRTADDLSLALGKAGFSIAESRSSAAAMRSVIVQAWARLAERLRNDDIDPRYGQMVLAECVRWVRVDAMMESGALDHVTISAERT